MVSVLHSAWLTGGVFSIPAMSLRPSLITALTRAIAGLVTVFCLGCSSYEPLIQSLLGQTSGMTCGSEMGMTTASADQPSSTGAALSAPGASHRNLDCGCSSCTGASPLSFVLALPAARQPEAYSPMVEEPSSVTRAPIAPPPQRVG